MPATVVEASGAERDGVFFLRSGGTPARVESLFDLLNDPDKPFLPFATDQGIDLLALENLVAVGYRLPADEASALEETGARRTAVELEAAGGRSFSGVLVHEAPPSVRRLSDVLNFVRSRFLMLLAGDRAWAVRRGAILRVRPRE